MAGRLSSNVISLLSSSDNELEVPVARKENVRRSPRILSKTKPLEKSTSSGNISKPVKATEKARGPKASTATTRAITKYAETITIISSSPPPLSPLRRQPSGQQHAVPSKSFSKIFGTLSSDPIFSQSSPPQIAPPILPRRSASKSPKPAAKPKAASTSLFASLLGSDITSDDTDLSIDLIVSGGSKTAAKAQSRVVPSKPVKSSNKGLSKSTLEILKEIESDRYDEDRTSKRRKVDRLDLGILDSSSPAPSSPPPAARLLADMEPSSSAPVRTGKLTEAEKEARRLEREAIKLAKANEREALKEQKRKEKDAKLVAKNEAQAMSTANRLKNSHVTTVTEMIVNISSDLFQKKEGLQLQQFLKELNVQHSPFDSDIPNVVKWKRVVEAEWDAVNDVFVPIPREVRVEKHVLVALEAKEFVDLASSESEMTTFVARIKAAYPLHKPIIIIEGLTKFINKSKSADARRYATEVRNRMNENSGRTARAAKATQVVDEDQVEEALLRMQVVHGCLIFQTVGYMGTAEAISNYTQHISQIPYKHAKATLNNSTNFCMDVGQVRSGTSVDDTYLKMLQQVHMSTEGVAKAIQTRYPSVQKLFDAFVEGGDDILKDIPIVRNRAGGLVTGRALGPAMSRKMARVFTGKEEWELES